MPIADQTIADQYAIYNGDSMEVMKDFPDASVDLSVYSPPFCNSAGGLYVYSSSERDLSNAGSYDEFFKMYEFFVREIHRLTMPGRISAVHCMDVPTGNSGGDAYLDFPGDIIDLHRKVGFSYVARHCIWKEPLKVRNRTMKKDLTHATVVEDSTRAGIAGADYLLIFRRAGINPVPVFHPQGFAEYFGDRLPPSDVLRYRGWTGNQIENRYSQWVWRQYASAFWDDIRGNLNKESDKIGTLPFLEAKDEEDERHVHPLQLDVINRIVAMRSNPGERVFTPFMGVGSEVFCAVKQGRFGIGAELKPSYYRQALKNLATIGDTEKEQTLLGLMEGEPAAEIENLEEAGT